MYRKEADGWLKHLDFIVLDMVCLQIAFILAYLLRWEKLDFYQADVYRDIAVVIEFAELFGVMFLKRFMASSGGGIMRSFWRRPGRTSSSAC